jgi:hypothetical protein
MKQKYEEEKKKRRSKGCEEGATSNNNLMPDPAAGYRRLHAEETDHHR